ncbi:hypothetical protein M514_07613 [Trichuris suis]|uniref:Uncharacterized protein n=1 Tax=Trichuris suis TaxID=68888 RepID=A0A085N827_9BILA|nr:hypothetical protein M513_07613 [Trichuris suis]KFD65623.1 hypothetical protein M514_07613 [Trichuris suis]
MERQKQSYHEGKAFQVNQDVWTPDYGKPGQPWKKGNIVDRNGDVMYVVRVHGILWRRHINQLRAVDARAHRFLSRGGRTSNNTDQRAQKEEHQRSLR